MAVGATVGATVGVGVAGAAVGVPIGVAAGGATVGAPVDVASVEQATTRKSTATVARYLLALQVRGITIMVSTARFKSNIPLLTAHFDPPQVSRRARTRWQHHTVKLSFLSVRRDLWYNDMRQVNH